MKKIVSCMVMLSSMLLFAQITNSSMEQISQFSIGKGKDQIQYQSSVNAGSSPNELSLLDGRDIWVGEIDDAKIYDINKKTIIGIVKYPLDTEKNIRNGSYHLFYSNHLVLNNGFSIVLYDVTKEPINILPPTRYTQSQANSRPYAIRDYAFFYGKDGFAYSIDPKGGLQTKDATKNLLLEWQKATWYCSDAERSVVADLLTTGKYIIVDGLFYPWNARHLYEYYTNRNVLMPSLAFLKSNGDIPLGFSMEGQIYIARGSGYGVYVLGQTGQIAAIIADSPVSLARTDPRFAADMPDSDNLSPTLYTVHPNGDLYALYAIKNEVARLFKATKSWGTDYVGMAKTGLVAGTEANMREKLQAMSSIELRITRNALFALYGYVFKSKDLSDYFLGYDWYTPDSKVKNDTTILTDDQKRLFNMIVAIEKDRVVAP